MRQQAHKSQSRHAARACRRSLFIAHACPERMSKARGLLLTAIVIAAVKLAALHVLQGAPHTFSESSASILLTSNVKCPCASVHTCACLCVFYV